jgi:hypothetical protein
MNPDGYGFRHGIGRVRLLATKPDFDHTLFVLHEQPNGFPTELPQVGQLAKAIVTFECGL